MYIDIPKIESENIACIVPHENPIIVLVTIFDFWVMHLSTWIASTCKHLGECLRSERKHSIALRVLALLNTPLPSGKALRGILFINLPIEWNTLQTSNYDVIIGTRDLFNISYSRELYLFSKFLHFEEIVRFKMAVCFEMIVSET